jgi:hypothetical protein
MVAKRKKKIERSAVVDDLHRPVFAVGVTR